MIAVIADDLSGAAELANAAVAAGLSAEVQIGRFVCGTKANIQHSTFNIQHRSGEQPAPLGGAGESAASIEHRGIEVICVDAQTRSSSEAGAAAVVGEIAKMIAAAGPTLVYKKCDSVLRGNVAAESLAMARALGKKRVLLAPANPSRNRVIRGGEYFVEGVPLDRTAFASDPEHPRRTSRVRELIGDAGEIVTPDVTSAADLERLAAAVDEETLPAGGVDFFNAVLGRWLKIQPEKGKSQSLLMPSATNIRAGAALFVCGSNAAWVGGRVKELAARGVKAFPMPEELFEAGAHDDSATRWVGEAAKGLRESGAVLLAIGEGQLAAGLTGETLAERLAAAAARVLAAAAVGRVFLEGGATASAVMRRLGVERFSVEASPGAGVGALRPVGQAGPFFLVKPGSYAWPEAVWER